MTAADHLTVMARDFAGEASVLQQAAARRDLLPTVRLVGELGADCADCHAELRWSEPGAAR
jgi:hypothetical protein